MKKDRIGLLGVMIIVLLEIVHLYIPIYFGKIIPSDFNGIFKLVIWFGMGNMIMFFFIYPYTNIHQSYINFLNKIRKPFLIEERFAQPFDWDRYRNDPDYQFKA